MLTAQNSRTEEVSLAAASSASSSAAAAAGASSSSSAARAGDVMMDENAVGGGYAVWVQPVTSELSHILRAPPKAAGGGTGGGGAAAEAAGDDSDSDDVPLSSMAQTITTRKHNIEVPNMEGWMRHVGEAPCTDLAKSLDARGHLERSLKSSLTAHNAAVASRKELAAKDRIARQQREREAAAARAKAEAQAAQAAAYAAAHGLDMSNVLQAVGGRAAAVAAADRWQAHVADLRER